MYTYFERIPEERRFTDMGDADGDELLDFWKSAWSSAGWEPRVLGRTEAELHPSYQEVEQQLQDLRLDDFYQITFRRYLAMAAVGGGWMCDWDVFPLRDFRSLQLPYQGQFAIYGTVAASLAVADAAHWLSTLKTMLEDAKHHRNPSHGYNLWSDTLAMYALLRNNTIHSHRLVMPANLLLLQSPPWSQEFCNKRQFRKKHLVVHFHPTSLLEGNVVPPEKRLPRFRAEMATQVIPNYETYCGVKVVEQDNNKE
jgi:hypothetical protein